MGKKKILSEAGLHTLKLPSENDLLGSVIKFLGFDRLMVRCSDGKERLCRIRGKMKRRVWIRDGDIVMVSPWDTQTDTRGDIIWRYTRGQAKQLRRRGILKDF